MGETFDPLSAVHTLPWVEVCHPRGALTLPAALQRGPTSMFHVLLLLACAVAIYVACEWFVNAVEWLGAGSRSARWRSARSSRPLGTALPESVVTFVAVVFGAASPPRTSASARRWAARSALGHRRLRRRPAARHCEPRQRCRTQAARAGPRRPPATARPPCSTPGDDLRRRQARLARDQTWFLAIFAVKVGARPGRLRRQAVARPRLLRGLRRCISGGRCAPAGSRPRTRAWSR